MQKKDTKKHWNTQIHKYIKIHWNCRNSQFEHMKRR